MAPDLSNCEMYGTCTETALGELIDPDLLTSVGTMLGNFGELGQLGIVWFSMGVAVWQMLVIGRAFLTAGSDNLLRHLSQTPYFHYQFIY